MTTAWCSPPTRSTTPPAPRCGGGPTPALEQLTADDGVHTAVVGGDTIVVRRVVARQPRARRSRWSAVRRSPATVATPLVTPNVTIRHVGERRLATALLLPHDVADDARLPVLRRPLRRAARPAGGAGAIRLPHLAVVRRPGLRGGRDRRSRHAGARRRRGSAASTATWPARCSRTRSTACSPSPPRIRGSTSPASPSAGWSFGGYLAALAVLRRPDVFHAAIAGAPVTDWRLYDTFYTERYLGHPDTDAAVYDASSLLPDAPKLERPLLLVHGLADDNVVERPHPAAVRRPCSPPAGPTRCCRSPASPTWPTRRRSPRTSCSSSSTSCGRRWACVAVATRRSAEA